jgi:enamine deaminase RidA (YjgF/YER057c/UK114 family)
MSTGNQTEQDKVVNNMSKTTGQVAKQATNVLGNLTNQIGKAIQNITNPRNDTNT